MFKFIIEQIKTYKTEKSMNQWNLLNLLVASTIGRQLVVQLYLVAHKGERGGRINSGFDLFLILLCNQKPLTVKAIPSSSDTLEDYVLSFCHSKTEFLLEGLDKD